MGLNEKNFIDITGNTSTVHYTHIEVQTSHKLAGKHVKPAKLWLENYSEVDNYINHFKTNDTVNATVDATANATVDDTVEANV